MNIMPPPSNPVNNITQNTDRESLNQFIHNLCLDGNILHRQGEKFSPPTTDVRLGTNGHRVGTWTGVGVTATLG